MRFGTIATALCIGGLFLVPLSHAQDVPAPAAKVEEPTSKPADPPMPPINPLQAKVDDQAKQIDALQKVLQSFQQKYWTCENADIINSALKPSQTK
jgi:hypothetical protein